MTRLAKRSCRWTSLWPGFLLGCMLLGCMCAAAQAQTSLSGSGLALKSTGSNLLDNSGYVGTYLVVPSGGATVTCAVTVVAAGAAGIPTLDGVPSADGRAEQALGELLRTATRAPSESRTSST